MDFGSECFIVETVTDCDAVTDESVLYHPFQKNSFTPALSDNLQFDDVNSGKKLIHTGLLLQGMAKKVKHVFSFPSIVTSQQSNDYRPTTPRNSPALSDNLQFDDVNSVTSQQSNDYRPTTPNLQQQEECELDDLYDFRYLKRAVEISLRRLERAAASRSREEFRLALPLFTDRVMLLVRHCVEDIDNNVAETPRL
ncbi:uncharacterized protein LOC125782624 isoform X3 [Astyanax mexicanus]|uniref:uncharacterized protein LOC125782618 isoform X3 n=1 Tax=Astyanax mexicanus TaxID=7994 RepID=UPI0020CB64FD|nr:uncharacterized protein LOC125782618 isoform X3 [Astyanax mexicanus]XP_049323229.1 uncharacterized protein LOC125782624 isoform X3 [Astyanax mexicanus]